MLTSSKLEGEGEERAGGWRGGGLEEGGMGGGGRGGLVLNKVVAYRACGI